MRQTIMKITKMLKDCNLDKRSKKQPKDKTQKNRTEIKHKLELKKLIIQNNKFYQMTHS